MDSRSQPVLSPKSDTSAGEPVGALRPEPKLGWRQVRLLSQIAAGYPICYPGIHPKSRPSFVALYDRGLIDVGRGGWDAATLTEAGRAYVAVAEAAEVARFARAATSPTTP